MATLIEIFGHADEEICAGCEGHDCGDCSPGEKKKTITLIEEFKELLEASELSGKFSLEFLEANTENIKRYEDVEKLLTMAKLEPIICIGGKIAYMGGFSPEGLLQELRKKY